ncbi:hypothetical protein J6590_012665 [Homalodisca vitripennis]|nr:hypothetical protein J6590_012665 [Homalodisca vitripennis]
MIISDGNVQLRGFLKGVSTCYSSLTPKTRLKGRGGPEVFKGSVLKADEIDCRKAGPTCARIYRNQARLSDLPHTPSTPTPTPRQPFQPPNPTRRPDRLLTHCLITS